MSKLNARSVSRRAFVGGATVSVAVLGAGCYGSFGVTNAVFDWNTEVSSNKFVRALIFFALVVIPVYGLMLFVDAVILNTIEFWTGKPVIGNKRVSKLDHGREVTSLATNDPHVVRHELRHDGQLVRVIYARRVSDQEVELLDEHMNVLTRGRMKSNGDVHVHDGADHTLAVLSAEQIDSACHAVENGSSVSDCARVAILDAPVRSEELALSLSNRG